MCTHEIDIEELDRKKTHILNIRYDRPNIQTAKNLLPLFNDIINSECVNFEALKRKHSFRGKNSYLIQAAHLLLKVCIFDKIEFSKIAAFLKLKIGRSTSGVIVVTVFMSGNPSYIDSQNKQRTQEFSCAFNCHYCPAEPGQPRSYLSLEPGVLRANAHNFDCVHQVHARLGTLFNIGHIDLDKLEIIISGGTWTSYPKEYREQFCRDLYYAANVFWDDEPRPRLSLLEEKHINKSAMTKIIGITIETRPDTINKHEIEFLRYLEVTRVQLGMQHLDQDVLDAINRQCSTEVAKYAIKLLKDCGFKVDIHLMPNLPFSTPEKDRDMLINRFLQLKEPVRRSHKYLSWAAWLNNEFELWEDWNLHEPDLVVDQWKVYPTMITPWTKIETWYKTGSYVPYSDSILQDILLDMKALMYPFIRLNRIVRDIPNDYIVNDTHLGNMRTELKSQLEYEGKKCRCIRCREVKTKLFDKNYIIVVRQYKSSDGIEYFISAETKDQEILYGFLRLRIPSEPCNNIFSCLSSCAIIRELHTYGQVESVLQTSQKSNVQHKGIGKRLIMIAERITKHNNLYSLAVISGVGVKKYYIKLGFQENVYDEGNYLYKHLN